MKLCISTLACPTWTLDQIIAGCAQAGVQGVDFRGIGDELDITRLPEFNQRLDQTLARFAEHGMSMPCLNTSIRLITSHAEEWNLFLDECQRYAQLAGQCGTLYLRVFGGAIPNTMTRDQARMLGERHLRQLGKICRIHGCKVALETHDAWRTSDEVLELVHALTPEEVGVLWDIEHSIHGGEEVERTVERLQRYICHVHIKDCIVEDGRRVSKLLGQGALPIRECVQALRDTGYDGWWSLETEKRWDAQAPEPEQSVPQFVRYMRSLG